MNYLKHYLPINLEAVCHEVYDPETNKRTGETKASVRVWLAGKALILKPDVGVISTQPPEEVLRTALAIALHRVLAGGQKQRRKGVGRI
jgi:hypothetical protein